jgi:hypothetical protein
MPGSPVSIGCMVVVTPGATGAPDTGTIVGILQATATAGGMPLATAGSICVMINLVIGPLGSAGVLVAGMPLIRMGDMIPSPPGVLAILGPPAAPFIVDGSPP